MIKAGLKKVLAKFGYEIRRPRMIASAPDFPLRTYSKVLYLKRMFDLVKDVKGDVVECGLAQGKTFLILGLLCREEMRGRKLWGFDSFEGFPQPSSLDESIRGSKKGDFGNTSVLAVQDLLIHSGLGKDFVDSQVTIIKGFFDASLSRYRGGPIAFLHLDVDLYDSYLACLKALYPNVAKGGVIMFDEYLGTGEYLNFPGAQKAIDEYLGPRVVWMERDLAAGKYFLIKKE